MKVFHKQKSLVIIGDSAFAEVAMEYFNNDSQYTVVGFAVEEGYRKHEFLHGLPVIHLSDLVKTFPPDENDAFVAVTYRELNRTRTRLLQKVKTYGYVLASYISSQALVWPSVEIGEHCFIFESNVVQPFARIGSNVILWSGNHIGHHARIADNVFISSHVVVSGFATIGDNSFLGVNSTLANNISIGRDCWIGPSALVTTNTDDFKVIRAVSPKPSAVSTHRLWKLKN